MGILVRGALFVCLLAGSASAHGGRYGEPGNRAPPPSDPSRVSWKLWWRLNRADILPLRAPATDPTAESCLESALPALETALVELTGKDRARLAISLGILGAGRVELRERVAGQLVPLIADSSQKSIVRLSAALALGVAGCRDADTVAALVDLLLDPAENEDSRTGATLALGLLDIDPAEESYPLAVHALWRVVRYEKPGRVRAAALLAMGLSGDRRHLPELLYAVSATDQTARSLAVLGLGKAAESDPELARRDVVGSIGRLLTGRSKRLIRAAANALGLIGSRPEIDRRIAFDMVQALGLASTSTDRGVSSAARISLGRIGAATWDHDLRRRVISAILPAGGAPPRSRPFAALAVGLMGRSPAVPNREWAFLLDSLLAEFESLPADSPDLGAYALALGMFGGPEVVARLTGALERPKTASSSRRHFLVALEMAGGAPATRPTGLERDAATCRELKTAEEVQATVRSLLWRIRSSDQPAATRSRMASFLAEILARDEARALHRIIWDIDDGDLGVVSRLLSVL